MKVIAIRKQHKANPFKAKTLGVKECLAVSPEDDGMCVCVCVCVCACWRVDDHLDGTLQFFIIRQMPPAAQVRTRPKRMLSESNEPVQAHLMHTHSQSSVPKAGQPHTHAPGPPLAPKLHLLD